MYVSPDRFEHRSRMDNLEITPVPGVGHVGAGMVTVVSYHPEHGVTYEQTEPVGDDWHRYKAPAPSVGPVRPS